MPSFRDINFMRNYQSETSRVKTLVPMLAPIFMFPSVLLSFGDGKVSVLTDQVCQL